MKGYRLFHVRILFFDCRNNVVFTWEGDVKGSDPADVGHTALLKARIASGNKLGVMSRMDICAREIDPYAQEPELYAVERAA